MKHPAPNLERSGLAVALIAALASGCAQSLHHAPLSTPQSGPHWDGVSNVSRAGDVYFAGQPTAEAFESIRDSGVAVVVNLRTEPEVQSLEFDEPTVVKELGMEYVSIPIASGKLGVRQAKQLESVLRRTEGPVLLHCSSANRVGALWALYLNQRRDVPVDEAIDIGRKAGMRSDALMQEIRKLAK